MKKLYAMFAVTTAMGTACVGHAQLGRMTGADWGAGQMTPQRTSWVQNDPLIKPDTMTYGEFKLQWTWKPTGAPRAAAVAGLIMQTGLAKPISMVAFGSTYFAGVDNDTGDEYWTRKLNVAAPATGCESVSTISRPNDANVRPPAAPRASTSPGPFVSAVGAPGEGAPVELTRGGMFGPPDEYIRAAAAARAAGQPLPPAPPSNGPGGFGGPGGPPPANADAARNAAPAAPGGQAAGGAALRPAGAAAAPAMPMRFNAPQGFYAVTPDGVLHTFGQNTAKDIVKPKQFLSAGAKVLDLITVNNTAYATVSGNCGGAAAGSYAIGTPANATGDTVSLKTGADVLGGPAFATDGGMFAVVGAGAGEYANAVIAIDPKTLAVKDSFTVPGGAASSPMVVKINDKELVAAAGKDGRVYLMDPASLGGSDHKTPLYASESFSKRQLTGAVTLASWKDAAGTTWITVPFAGASPIGGAAASGGIVALKIGGSSEHPILSADWATSALNPSVPPIVVSGVVFGVTDTRTTLVALDGSTGKQLWASGKTILSAVSSQPWYSLGQVYVAAGDGTVYAFGFPMERY
jgi:outer membrane protein assembly factor BamB